MADNLPEEDNISAEEVSQILYGTPEIIDDDDDRIANNSSLNNNAKQVSEALRDDDWIASNLSGEEISSLYNAWMGRNNMYNLANDVNKFITVYCTDTKIENMTMSNLNPFDLACVYYNRMNNNPDIKFDPMNDYCKFSLIWGCKFYKKQRADKHEPESESLLHLNIHQFQKK